MTTPIKYSIAKLLKEKGFDKYGYLQDVWLGNKYKWKGKGKNKKSVEIPVFGLGATSVLPTIAEVVMWLYEKHGIWIFTDYTNKLFYWTIQKGETDYLHQEDIILGTTIRNDGFNSPTEAYEAAIEYTLKNLI